MSDPSYVPNWKGCDPQDFDYFAWWMNELTAQGLHSKSDIALAFAMMSEQIEILEAELRSERTKRRLSDNAGASNAE